MKKIGQSSDYLSSGMTSGECCVFRQSLHDSRAAAILVWARAEPSDWSSSGESQTPLVRPFSLIPWSPWRDFAQLVGGFKQSKKAPAPKVLERKTGRKKLQILGLRKSAAVELRMSSVKEASALFACSKCFTRHPFEELSQGQQLCKVRRTILS